MSKYNIELFGWVCASVVHLLFSMNYVQKDIKKKVFIYNYCLQHRPCQ